MNLGENLYRLRTQRNMSQGDVAEALEVSRQSVSKWENNSAVPELDKLVKLSELYGITLDELVGRPAPKEESPSASSAPTQHIQQITVHNEFRPLSHRLIIGVILICSGLLFLPFALSATRYTPMVNCLIFFAALTLCGVSTLLFRFPYIPWGWVLLCAFTAYIFLNCHWESEYFSLSLIAFSLVIMIWWTSYADRKGLLSVPEWLWWVGGITLGFLLILFFINFVPTFWISPVEHAVARG